MKNIIFILLCLLFISCNRYAFKEEKIKDMDSAVQQYYDNDVKSVIKYYSRSANPYLPDIAIAEDLDWTFSNCRRKPAKVLFNNEGIMTDMAAKEIASFTSQPATQYGDYFFHMSHADGCWRIYVAFQNSPNQWLMLAIPVPTY